MLKFSNRSSFLFVSFQWLRARFIRRLLQNHVRFKSNVWTTTEIVRFSRLFGFSPVLSVQNNHVKQENSIKDMIKSTIEQEHLQNDGLTFNQPILSWLTTAENKIEKFYSEKNQRKSIVDDTIIVVDDDDETHANVMSPSQRFCMDDASAKRKLYLSIDSNSSDECSWINEMCRSIRMNLRPEEIVDGVMYPATQKCLSVALRSFVEDLLRRTVALKAADYSTTSNELVIGNDDVMRAISKIKHFDFLTNRNFGVER